MIKIRTEPGLWEGMGVAQDLHFENCPTLNCLGGELHYPSWLKKPYCPYCRKFMPGKIWGVMEGYGKRIAYHLEG